MHSHHLIHRDIKLSNLLYSRGNLILADFGLSRPYADRHVALTPSVASLWYRPPELLFGSTRYTQAIDLWAAGCVLAELLRGSPLVAGMNETDQIHKMIECVGVPRVEEWPDLASMPAIRDGSLQLSSLSSPRKLLDMFCHLSLPGLRLLTAMLEYNPSTRWTAARALESRYLKDDPPLPCPSDQMPRFLAQRL